MSALEELYREVVLEHHRYPAGRAPLERVDVEATGQNPSCGDEVTLRLSFEGDVVSGVQVEGRGCALSTASGSILASMLKGKSSAEALALIEAFKELLRTGELDLDLGDLDALVGVRRFPLRVKCALLPWTTLEEALASHAGEACHG